MWCVALRCEYHKEEQTNARAKAIICNLCGGHHHRQPQKQPPKPPTQKQIESPLALALASPVQSNLWKLFELNVLNRVPASLSWPLYQRRSRSCCKFISWHKVSCFLFRQRSAEWDCTSAVSARKTASQRYTDKFSFIAVLGPKSFIAPSKGNAFQMPTK